MIALQLVFFFLHFFILNLWTSVLVNFSNGIIKNGPSNEICLFVAFSRETDAFFVWGRGGGRKRKTKDKWAVTKDKPECFPRNPSMWLWKDNEADVWGGGGAGRMYFLVFASRS